MPAPPRGLYETLLTQALKADLSQLPASHAATTDSLRPVDAADRIALHLGRVLERALDAVDDKQRVALGIELAGKLVAEIDRQVSKADLASHAPAQPGTILRAIAARLPDGTAETITGPLIPLLDTTLLTNAPGEPRVGKQLEEEIHSADRVDVVMAFVRLSGIRPLLAALRSHCQAGRALRVLTTTYTGSTEPKALDALAELGAEVRVSYDTSSTRLHEKAWLFQRALVEFRFMRKFRALLGGALKNVPEQIRAGFASSPPVATSSWFRFRERVLENILNALPSKWASRMGFALTSYF